MMIELSTFSILAAGATGVAEVSVEMISVVEVWLDIMITPLFGFVLLITISFVFWITARFLGFLVFDINYIVVVCCYCHVMFFEESFV